MKRLQKNIQKGRFMKKRPTAKKKKDGDSSSETSEEEDKVDPALTHRILQAYLSSTYRHEALKGNLEDMNEEEKLILAALESFIRADGARLDTIRNITTHDIGR